MQSIHMRHADIESSVRAKCDESQWRKSDQNNAGQKGFITASRKHWQ